MVWAELPLPAGLTAGIHPTSAQAVEMEDTLGGWCGAPSFLTEQGVRGLGLCDRECWAAEGGKRMVAGTRCSFAMLE